jgi:hypothetical protein
MCSYMHELKGLAGRCGDRDQRGKPDRGFVIMAFSTADVPGEWS